VGGEGMAKSVGGDAPVESRGARPALDDTVRPPRGEPAPARIGEEGAAALSAHGEPCLDGREGGVAHWYHPLLASLAHDAHGSWPPVHVAQVETAALRDAEACGIEQLEQRPVAQPRRRAVELRVEEVLRFVLG